METAYEAVFVVDPQLAEEGVSAIIEKYTGVVTRGGGTIDDVDRLEPRRLAYPIKGKREGQYVVANFHSEPAAKDELDRIFRISDDVLRYLIIKQDKRADRFPSQTRASEYDRREREQAARNAQYSNNASSGGGSVQPVTDLSASATSGGVENANGVTDGHENVASLPPAGDNTLEAVAPEAEQEVTAATPASADTAETA